LAQKFSLENWHRKQKLIPTIHRPIQLEEYKTTCLSIGVSLFCNGIDSLNLYCQLYSIYLAAKNNLYSFADAPIWSGVEDFSVMLIPSSSDHGFVHVDYIVVNIYLELKERTKIFNRLLFHDARKYKILFDYDASSA
jgi:hypothetical protein